MRSFPAMCLNTEVEPVKRVLVDHFGGQRFEVMEEDDPRPDPGEVCVRVLAAGVSISDAQMRAGPSSSTTQTSS